MYDVSGDFGKVRKIENMGYYTKIELLDHYLSVGWHKCNSLYHIKTPEGNPGILIFFTLNGNGMLVFDQKEYLLKKNTIAIVPPRKHCEYFTPDNKIWEFYWIHLQCFNSSSLLSYVIERKGYVFLLKNLEKITSRIEDLLTAKNDGQEQELINSRIIAQIIYDLLENTLVASQHKKHESELAKQIICYIKENFKSNITLEDISKKIYLSTDHIIRYFKKETGYTPYNYLKTYRLMRACDLLSFSNLTVKQIATEVGYNSESSFISQFKVQNKISPNEYRKLKYNNIPT